MSHNTMTNKNLIELRDIAATRWQDCQTCTPAGMASCHRADCTVMDARAELAGRAEKKVRAR